jgi:SAM-dependent methyltransferase
METTRDRTETTSSELQPDHSAEAGDIAAVSALLEIGQQVGILPLVWDAELSAAAVAEALGLPEAKVAEYLTVLCSAGLMERLPGEPVRYRRLPELVSWRHRAGYISWAMNANRPYITHAREFFLDGPAARERHSRVGRDVAVSSQWVGSLSFYPATLEMIVARRPRRFVDLGAGSARLVIEVVLAVEGSTGVALDIDAGACAEAELAARRAGVQDRVTVVERSIQSLATDPELLAAADVVHAGFVFHDMMPDEENVADRILANCHRHLAPGGIMAITDAAPYVQNERERKFSALMTYYHHGFMGRRLLAEEEWAAKLRAAGFARVETSRHLLPSSRLIVATR